MDPLGIRIDLYYSMDLNRVMSVSPNLDHNAGFRISFIFPLILYCLDAYLINPWLTVMVACSQVGLFVLVMTRLPRARFRHKWLVIFGGFVIDFASISAAWIILLSLNTGRISFKEIFIPGLIEERSVLCSAGTFLRVIGLAVDRFWPGLSRMPRGQR